MLGDLLLDDRRSKDQLRVGCPHRDKGEWETAPVSAVNDHHNTILVNQGNPASAPANLPR
jgi:hypothetical protein